MLNPAGETNKATNKTILDGRDERRARKGGNGVRRIVCLLVIAVLFTVAAFAQTSVTPRDVGVLLFDNESGTQVTKIGIVFSEAVKFETSDLIAIGGCESTLVSLSNNYALIDVVVEAGGTLQLTLPSDYTDVEVTNAYWFE